MIFKTTTTISPYFHDVLNDLISTTEGQNFLFWEKHYRCAEKLKPRFKTKARFPAQQLLMAQVEPQSQHSISIRCSCSFHGDNAYLGFSNITSDTWCTRTGAVVFLMNLFRKSFVITQYIVLLCSLCKVCGPCAIFGSFVKYTAWRG